ncbi:tRNA-splicing endonuclease subunit Sen54 [Lingula anatina]|uniref:tRNA-splicing endonuclease subunit Sen54 n=1 Tax=Lingula anatina TaxID=7574 RepID=A0A1S3H7P3_LINAN|nr:tRNA-splicing endonuclease subunit Sen54 [Lingula anatina]|eukprot:XP_013381139.1 tRNA-splicing endonuclease subunit Sen54 [Lingula anatina]
MPLTDHGYKTKNWRKFFVERREVLQEEKVGRIGALCRGEWKPEERVIELKQTGKFFHHMGYAEGDHLCLYPEEALFLMEVCSLEVYYAGLSLSIQQAYSMFLSESMTLGEYQTYSYLSRLGYIVMRHSGPSSVTAYERQIRLDQHISDISYSKKRKNMDDAGNTASKLSKTEESLNAQSSELCDKIPDQTSDATHNDIPIASTEKTDKLEAGTLPKKSVQHFLPYTMWNFDEINFPDIGRKDLQTHTLQMMPPRKNLLPSGVKINPNSCMVDVHKLHSSGENATGDNDEDDDGDDSHIYTTNNLTYSLMNASVMKAQVKAKNWSEYKAECRKMVTDFRVEQSPVGVLWQGEVTPLVTPDMASCTGNLLEHLQVIENIHQNKKKEKLSVVTGSRKISFDVFKPDSNFKKSQPGLPDHRICVISSSEKPPDLGQLIGLQKQCSDGVPLHWSVVDHGDIAFYKYCYTSLPVDVTMG